MIFGDRLLLSISLVCLSEFAFAQASCNDRLTFANDGSISEWVICQRGKPLTIVPENHQFLEVIVSFDGLQPDPTLNWSRVPSSADEQSFLGTSTRYSHEIVRTYRQSSSSKLSHSISIRNVTDPLLPEVSLRVGLNSASNSNAGATRTLADYVYGFARTYIAVGDRNWELANIGDRTNGLAVTSRHKVVILHSGIDFELRARHGTNVESDSSRLTDGLVVALHSDPLDPQDDVIFNHDISASTMQTPILAEAGYDSLMFADLWAPLALLCKWIEALLIGMSSIAGGFGPAIILLAVAIRLITYPASLWAARKQHEYAVIADKIKPVMAEIRKKYKGAEQSERVLAVYRDNKINPFTGLKGSVGLFVQIPFLLAVFNITTTSSIFQSEAFLWVTDLSQADAAFILPFSIRFLGNSVNALPLILGTVNILFADSTAATSTSARWMPILISLVIVLVFYSFSAALVLYWLTVNVLQVGERLFQARFERLVEK